MVRALMVLVGLLLAASAQARELVRIGGYEFAPFVSLDGGGKATGVALDLMDELNRYQDRYQFSFVVTSPNRRYRDFEDGKFDMILFESPGWGWTEKGLPIEASDVFLHGGELYIAQAKAGRGQDYFADLTDKRMVGILGYHYGFAGFEADPGLLAKRFAVTLVNDNAASIELILKGRGDVAVVTDAYLKRYLKSHPGVADKLLVSERFDQRYAHRALVRKGAILSAAEVSRLLAAMEKDGTLLRLWRSVGIKD
jgi:ABC-type amino acid transport substrate-binding protein